MELAMIKPSFWSADEDDYIDVWYQTLIEVMASLKLISRETCGAMWLMHTEDLYNTLWKYKE
jgi:hypothetical protein